MDEGSGGGVMNKYRLEQRDDSCSQKLHSNHTIHSSLTEIIPKINELLNT